MERGGTQSADQVSGRPGSMDIVYENHLPYTSLGLPTATVVIRRARPRQQGISHFSGHNLITHNSNKFVPLLKKLLPPWRLPPILSRLAFPLQRPFTEPPIPKSRPHDPSSPMQGKRCSSPAATQVSDMRSQEPLPRPAQRESLSSDDAPTSLLQPHHALEHSSPKSRRWDEHATCLCRRSVGGARQGRHYR